MTGILVCLSCSKENDTIEELTATSFRGSTVVCQPDDATVSLLAGSVTGLQDGPLARAKFNTPADVAIDLEGSLIIADWGNHSIRKIKNGKVTTIAGTGQPGFQNGKSTQASFHSPSSVAVDHDNNIYVVDLDNHAIRKIDIKGNVTTLAGGLSVGNADGSGKDAQFYYPYGITYSVDGNLYITDQGYGRIRKVTLSGQVATVAGSVTGHADGFSNEAQFNYPRGITSDNNGTLYVADWRGHKIRKVDPSGFVTTIAGSKEGYQDGQASKSRFKRPNGIALDDGGNIYVSEENNQKIRVITTNDMVKTIAGSPVGYQNGVGVAAKFNYPRGIAISGTQMYIADMNNHRIRKAILAFDCVF